MPLGEDFAAGNTVVMVVEGRISRAVHIWQTDFTSTPPLTTRRAVAESLIAKGVEELTNSGDVAESTALVRTGAQRASPSPLFLRQRRRCHLLAYRCRAGLAARCQRSWLPISAPRCRPHTHADPARAALRRSQCP